MAAPLSGASGVHGIEDILATAEVPSILLDTLAELHPTVLGCRHQDHMAVLPGAVGRETLCLAVLLGF